jgi:hypothetical protein
MDNITFAAWVSVRLKFSDEDRRACFDTARTLVEIAREVRKNGLLSIDDKIPSMPDLFMRRALKLAVDSIAPEMIKEIMQNWTVFGNYRGAELLRRLIIIEGALAIVNGWSPNQIYHQLASFFGEELSDEYFGSTELERRNSQTEEGFWNRVKRVQFVASEELEQILKNLDNMVIQLLIRHLHESDLVMAFKGLSEDVIRRFLDNTAKGAQIMLMEKYNYLRGRDSDITDITAAQEKILAKIKDLEKRGEIIYAK